MTEAALTEAILQVFIKYTSRTGAAISLSAIAGYLRDDRNIRIDTIDLWDHVEAEGFTIENRSKKPGRNLIYVSV